MWGQDKRLWAVNRGSKPQWAHTGQNFYSTSWGMTQKSFKRISEILKSILQWTASQWRDARTGPTVSIVLVQLRGWYFGSEVLTLFWSPIRVTYIFQLTSSWTTWGGSDGWRRRRSSNKPCTAAEIWLYTRHLGRYWLSIIQETENR